MEKTSAKPSSETKTRDLNEYANQMGKFVEELKESVGGMSDLEVAMMVEENKVCKAMFQRVFNVLVIEQTERLNRTKEIEDGLKNL